MTTFFAGASKLTVRPQLSTEVLLLAFVEAPDEVLLAVGSLSALAVVVVVFTAFLAVSGVESSVSVPQLVVRKATVRAVATSALVFVRDKMNVPFDCDNGY